MTARPKLTAAQIQTLQELAKPGNAAHYMPYMGRFNQSAYWYIESTRGKFTRQIEKFISLGYARKHDVTWSGAKATITPAGRAALAELDEQEPK